MASILLCLLITACATPQQTIDLKISPPNIPVSMELKSVPFYPQRDYQCGPAALASVINHGQIQTSPEDLLPLVYIPALKGSLQVEMLAATSQFDRLSVQLDPKLSVILREVAAGNPVLILQNLGFEAYPFWHYAVVIGYDLQNQEIILRSGEIERLIRPFSVFERTWQRSDFWAVAVVPPDVIPITVPEDSYVRAIVDFENKASRPAIQRAYQTAVQRWPQNYLLHMGRGNAAYALGHYAQAQQAFEYATRIQPERSEAWNNLAYALSRQGDRAGALTAVEQAILLAPDNSDLLENHREISKKYSF